MEKIRRNPDDRLQRNFAMSMRLLQSDRLTSGPAIDADHAASRGWHRGRQLASSERDEKLAVCQQRWTTLTGYSMIPGVVESNPLTKQPSGES